METVDRRAFLERGARAALGGALIPASLAGLVSACTEKDITGAIVARSTPVRQAGIGSGGYGDPLPGTDTVLLPADFRATTFGTVGEMMSDGIPTPIAHDGMAAFYAGPSKVRLVRNQESRNPAGTPAISPINAYDPAANGGTTTVELDVDYSTPGHPAIRVVKSFVSLSGTITNCAGGLTPWGSWLSCEEDVRGIREGFTKTHGWVYEVPSAANGPVPAIPIKEMGRFSHEAVSVDAFSGIVYLTEDNGFPPGSGFYRFLPNDKRQLGAGGKLQMARIKGSPRVELWRGSTIGINVGDRFEVEWVDIDHVDPDPTDQMSETSRRAAVFNQGLEQGGAAFNRLEGCWWGEGSIFFHDTRGGAVQRGHVWRYLPQKDTGGKLQLLFESPGEDVLDSPDNITVSPRGGIVLCEDGSGSQFVRGLTPDAEIFTLAQNNLNQNEFAGACFSPDGRILFVNIQGATNGNPVVTGASPASRGVTIAITGPWERGSL